MLTYLRAHGIPLVAYTPLAQGRAANGPVLTHIGLKHGITAAQITIAWLLDSLRLWLFRRPNGDRVS